MAWIIIYTPMILSYTLHSDRQMCKLLKSRVENCIFAMHRWMDDNELKLNHDKTEAMLIQARYCPSPFFQFLCLADESVESWCYL